MHLDIPNITIKPYVRMTKRGKYVDPQAQEYMASKDELAYRIKTAMRAQNAEMLPAQTPLSVDLTVTVPTSQGHRADTDNIIKAVLDACNGIAFPDDRWVDCITAMRCIGKKPSLTLHIQEYTADN